MNGAPQLFFSCRAPQSLVRADRARARHPAPRRAKKILALAADRREVRRTRSLPVWQNSNGASRASRFFVLAVWFLDRQTGALAGASGALRYLSFAAGFARTSGGGRRPALATRPTAGGGKSQRSVSHVSPSIRPAAGVAEARARPAQRIGVERQRPALAPGNAGSPSSIAGTTVFTEDHRWLRASAGARIVW